MNHSASVLTAVEEKQKTIVKHIPIQENRTLRQVHKSAPSESSFESIQSMQAVDGLLTHIREIGEQYAKTVRSATAELMNHLDKNTESSSFSRRHKSNIHHEIKNAENVFEGRIVNAAEQMNVQRERLVQQIRSLQRRCSVQILEKIVQTEDLVVSEEVRIQQMIEDPTVELGYLMRAHAANREMKAYLQGLKFQVQQGQE